MKQLMESAGGASRGDEPRRVITLCLREALFAQVKEDLEVGAQPERTFTDVEVIAFLTRHPDILGSIVRFDEVDSTDRARIWEEQRAERGRQAAANSER